MHEGDIASAEPSPSPAGPPAGPYRRVSYRRVSYRRVSYRRVRLRGGSELLTYPVVAALADLAVVDTTIAVQHAGSAYQVATRMPDAAAAQDRPTAMNDGTVY